MSEITAVFEVFAGLTEDIRLDVKDLSPEQMADKIERSTAAGVSLCHECAHEVNDPQVGDLVAFTVDGVEYSKRDGEWVKSDV
jgi:hypothetical protein